MKQYKVTFLPAGITIPVEEGTTLLQAEIQAGLKPSAPCGGNGTCGKCKVTLQAGAEVLACQTIVTANMVVTVPQESAARILTQSQSVQCVPDGTDAYTLAIDIGTTTVVAYLLSGKTGALLAQASTLNPQGQYGADVISRIQYVLDGGQELQQCILAALDSLTRQAAKQAGIAPEDITRAAIVGNTAMHHLLLGIDPRPLITPPYMPKERLERTLKASGWLPISGEIRILPNIAGFVGGETVGCLVASRFDRREALTLLIDIGTNGEMVLGDRDRAVACSTAAGPAFEGAEIAMGMPAATGAISKVWLEDGKICCSTIDDAKAIGICGSGLIDALAVFLETGLLDETGLMADEDEVEDAFAGYLGEDEDGTCVWLTDEVKVTQADVRKLQLAKASIAAGIQILLEERGLAVTEVEQVILAGGFGSFLNKKSAAAIGLIPAELEQVTVSVGNAAGEGAVSAALSEDARQELGSLQQEMRYVELSTHKKFSDAYMAEMFFE